MVNAVVNEIKSLLPQGEVKTDPGDLAHYGSDWTKAGAPAPSCIVLPKTVTEVAAVIRFARDRGLKIVPSGGRTGLAGGAMALDGEVVLSLERMNRILEVDPFEPAMTVEAGCTLAQVHMTALEHGLSFPLDLGAKGSCQIGGNVSTNAGGLHFIRYGGARDQILGLEVVDGSGRVMQLGHGLKKDNSGYDLKQLFIGAEGTLGIVTKAILRLQGSSHDELQVALFAVDGFAKILEILRLCRARHLTLNAFEFFTRESLRIVMGEKALLQPLGESTDFYVLLEIDSAREKCEQAFEAFFEAGLVSDGQLASSSTEARRIWSYRELITESIAQHGHVLKNDITVRIKDLPAFVTDLKGMVQAAAIRDFTMVLFGHVGDGNIHLNYVMPKTAGSREHFLSLAKPLAERVFALLQRYHGSISAEHGIGLIKKRELTMTRTPEELDVMRKIKKIFDPAGILNPGKIFD